MITLKDFMELVNYRITEGSDYCWQCYGPNAYTLDFWNQDHNGHSASIIFDTQTHVAYEVTVCDYKRNRAYRLINPDFAEAHRNESVARDVNFKEAWDEVDFVDLEVDDDFIQKALSIFNDEDYDTRVEVPLDLDDDTMFKLMKLAHERDLTLNELVEDILRNEIARLKEENV